VAEKKHKQHKILRFPILITAPFLALYCTVFYLIALFLLSEQRGNRKQWELNGEHSRNLLFVMRIQKR
jgi:hypothetical protein